MYYGHNTCTMAMIHVLWRSRTPNSLPLSLKPSHFTTTWVLIVKTQYFETSRNRKVESHFTTTSVLIVKTQYFESPRNHKVKSPIIEDVWTSLLVIKTQCFESPRHHKVKKLLPSPSPHLLDWVEIGKFSLAIY